MDVLDFLDKNNFTFKRKNYTKDDVYTKEYGKYVIVYVVTAKTGGLKFVEIVLQKWASSLFTKKPKLSLLTKLNSIVQQVSKLETKEELVGFGEKYKLQVFDSKQSTFENYTFSARKYIREARALLA